MDCFSDSPQPYKIVKFTPESCKPYVDAVLKRNIRFTNPYEVANYFFVLRDNHSKGFEGFKEINQIFIEMNGIVYYFKNVDEAPIRFSSKECKEEWQPIPTEKLTDDRELYVVLDYVAPGLHLIFIPHQTKEQLRPLYSFSQHQESFSYTCGDNGNLWKILQRKKKDHVFCTKTLFSRMFASKNITEPLSKIRFDKKTSGSLSVIVNRNSPTTRLIPGIPKYLVTKDGKVYGDGMKLIKHTGDKKEPQAVLIVKGVPTSFYVKDLVESAWATESLPGAEAKIEEESLPGAEAKIEDDFLLNDIEDEHTNQTKEALDIFISLFTADTWFKEVARVVESNHETKKTFLAFLKSFSSGIPKNKELEDALDATKYEPLISLLDSTSIPDTNPVICNIFDNL